MGLQAETAAWGCTHSTHHIWTIEGQTMACWDIQAGEGSASIGGSPAPHSPCPGHILRHRPFIPLMYKKNCQGRWRRQSSPSLTPGLGRINTPRSDQAAPGQRHPPKPQPGNMLGKGLRASGETFIHPEASRQLCSRRAPWLDTRRL